MDTTGVIIIFKKREVTIRTLKDVYDNQVDRLHSVTLNIVTRTGECVSSNTVSFAHIEDDEIRDDLIVVKNQWNTVFISKSIIDKYLFTSEPSQGHLIFTFVV